MICNFDPRVTSRGSNLHRTAPNILDIERVSVGFIGMVSKHHYFCVSSDVCDGRSKSSHFALYVFACVQDSIVLRMMHTSKNLQMAHVIMAVASLRQLSEPAKSLPAIVPALARLLFASVR